MRRRRSKDHDDGDDSLLEGGSKQGVLFEVPAHAIEQEAREAKRCTATLLFERDPDTYNDIVKLLAANVPIRKIKHDFGLGTDTVMAIRRRETKEVGTLKGIIADTLLHGAAVGAETAAALVAECDDPVAAAMATKMMAETSNLMRGQATQLIGHLHVHVDAQAAGRNLEEKARRMGLNGGEKPALALDAAGSALAIPSADNVSADNDSLIVDIESVKSLSHIHCSTKPAQTAPFQTGGGGGAEAAAPETP